MQKSYQQTSNIVTGSGLRSSKQKNKKSNVHQDHEYVLYTLQKSLDILTGNREHITHQLKYEHVLLFCHCKLNYGSFYSFLSSQL